MIKRVAEEEPTMLQPGNTYTDDVNNNNVTIPKKGLKEAINYRLFKKERLFVWNTMRLG